MEARDAIVEACELVEEAWERAWERGWDGMRRRGRRGRGDGARCWHNVSKHDARGASGHDRRCIGGFGCVCVCVGALAIFCKL